MERMNTVAYFRTKRDILRSENCTKSQVQEYEVVTRTLLEAYGIAGDKQEFQSVIDDKYPLVGPTDIPYVYIGLGHTYLVSNSTTYDADEAKRNHTVSLMSGSMYYSERLDVEEGDTRHKILTAIDNCMTVAETLRDKPKCTCCEVPMIHRPVYTYDEYLLGKHLGNDGSRKRLHKLYKNNKHCLIMNDLYAWCCPCCGIKRFPWQSLDFSPETGKAHKIFNCSCGNPLTYSTEDSVEKELYCMTCHNRYSEETAFALNMTL